MTFYSKPTPQHLIFWIVLPFIVLCILVITNDMKLDLTNSVVAATYFLIAFNIMMQQYQCYEIKNGEFKIKVFAYITHYAANTSKLISVNYRKNGWLKRFFGMPSKTIELYFERDGHVELWNSDPEVYKIFQQILDAKSTP